MRNVASAEIPGSWWQLCAWQIPGTACSSISLRGRGLAPGWALSWLPPILLSLAFLCLQDGQILTAPALLRRWSPHRQEQIDVTLPAAQGDVGSPGSLPFQQAPHSRSSLLFQHWGLYLLVLTSRLATAMSWLCQSLLSSEVVVSQEQLLGFLGSSLRDPSLGDSALSKWEAFPCASILLGNQMCFPLWAAILAGPFLEGWLQAGGMTP